MHRKRLYSCLFFFLFYGLLFWGSSSAAYSTDDPTTAVNKGLTYLAGMQNTDGGFSSDRDRPSSEVTTAWVIMALEAAGEDINSGKWVKNGHSPLDYLRNGITSPTATTDYARTLLALTAAGGDVFFHDANLVEKIISFQQDNGQFAQPDRNELDMINAHLWSILALYSADREIPQKGKALEWLKLRQNEDGGFGWAVGLASDPDDTGIAITVLALLGDKPNSSRTIQKALAYLHGQEGEDGGFAWTGQKSNAATDAWVIQGLVAVGSDPADTRWQVQANNPITHLLKLQNDDGSFNWTREVRSQPVLMTSYAIMALSKKPLPVNIDYARLPAEKISISLTVDCQEAVVNGQKQFLDSPPVIINNHTLVPLRVVGEWLGARFRWISGSSSIEITFNDRTFYLLVGQATEDLDFPTAIIEGGRTLVPVRYISEKLGAQVIWLEKERRIKIEK